MNFSELDKIFRDMDEISKNVKELKRKKTPGTMNIAEIMGRHHQENKHSDILSCLLDPNKEHNHQEFGDCFLDLLREKGLAIGGKSIKKVTREAVTGTMRRMDIFMVTDALEKIIVENKVYSGDQENQLKDYVANAGNPFVVYLTPYGQRPSGYSIPQEKLQDLEKHHRFTCLSYEKDILDWLGRLETKVNEDVLRAALIQYTDTVKGITNQKKEFNMNQEIAKELYEKYGELSREDLLKKLHAIYECNDNIDLVLFMNLFKDICIEAKNMYGLEMKLFYDDDEYEYENAAKMKMWEEKVLVNQKRFGVCCRYGNGDIIDFFVRDLNGKQIVAAGDVSLDIGGSEEITEDGYEHAKVSNGWIYKAIRDTPDTWGKRGGEKVLWEAGGGKISTHIAGAFKAARPKA